MTPQVTQVLDFDPDVIVFSAQGADCWNLVDGLGRAGWTSDTIPLIFTGSCIDFEKMKAAGDLAKGIYFVGAAGASLTDPASITDPRFKLEATNYAEKAAELGMPAADITKGFGASGWSNDDDHLGADQHRRQRGWRTHARDVHGPDGRHVRQPHLRLGALRVRRRSGPLHGGLQLQGQSLAVERRPS